MPESEALITRDILSIGTRWILLLALGLAAAGLFPASLWIFLGGLWNLYLTAALFLRRPLSWQRKAGLGIDFVLAGLIFIFSGGGRGFLGWVGIMPLMTAAIYYQINGALILSLVNLLLQGITLFSQVDSQSGLLYTLSLAILYLVAGLTTGYFIDKINFNLPTPEVEPIQPIVEHKSIDAEKRKALIDLITTLSASLNYRRVLEAALDMSTKALVSEDKLEEKLVSAVMLFTDNAGEEQKLQVESSHKLPPSDLRISMTGTSGILGRAIESGDPQLIQKPEKDPELSRAVAFRSCQSVYCIPLKNGLNVYGVLLYGHPDATYFTLEHQEVLEVVGNQAMIAIENARLYHQLELEKERITEIQEDARKKLARDLHDGPTQSVSAMAMRVNFARRLLERDPGAAEEELFKIEELARRTTKEIRHMLFTLRPLVLETQGLIAALESMAEKMKETYSQDVVVQADSQVIPELEMGKQGVIFYIAEEAVNNARKHAQAAHILVSLHFSGEDIVLLEVRDDGCGFNTREINDNYESRGSLGMVNMRERTELVNGLLQVDSQVGKGTRIRVWVPLTESAADKLRHGAVQV